MIDKLLGGRGAIVVIINYVMVAKVGNYGRVATVVCRQIVDDTLQFAVVCGCVFSGSACWGVRARSSSCLASECNQACIVNCLIQWVVLLTGFVILLYIIALFILFELYIFMLTHGEFYC